MRVALAAVAAIALVAVRALPLVAQGEPAPPPVRPDSSGRVTYFVADGIERSGYHEGDKQLVTWAFEEWERGLAGAIAFVESTEEGEALIPIFWLPPSIKRVAPGAVVSHLGVTQTRVHKRRISRMVTIHPDLSVLGPEMGRRLEKDPLLRDVVVYHTCLHEIGHTLGLNHSEIDTDIMAAGSRREEAAMKYDRLRRLVTDRASIARTRWLTASDIRRARQVYGVPLGLPVGTADEALPRELSPK